MDSAFDIEKLFCILCSFEYLTLESRHVASIRILPHENQTTAKSRQTFLYSVNIRFERNIFPSKYREQSLIGSE